VVLADPLLHKNAPRATVGYFVPLSHPFDADCHVRTNQRNAVHQRCSAGGNAGTPYLIPNGTSHSPSSRACVYTQPPAISHHCHSCPKPALNAAQPAGVQSHPMALWIPACAGMTGSGPKNKHPAAFKFIRRSYSALLHWLALSPARAERARKNAFFTGLFFACLVREA